MTDAWGDLATYRQKKRQKFKIYLTKGVSVNPKAYCCDDNTINDQKPPVAILTATPNPIQEGDNCTLDMTGSYDPDGGGIADPGGYEITDGIGGTYAATKTQVVNYPNAGRFEARGVVTDADGLMGEASTWVDVLAGEDPVVPGLTGKKVIIGTLSQGMFLTDDILATPPTWAALNDGLAGDALKINGFIRDPWDPSDTVINYTEDGIYKNTSILAGGTWAQKLSNAQLDTLLGFAGARIAAMQGSITQEGLIFAVAGEPIGVGITRKWIIRSIDGAENWTKQAQIIGTGAFGPRIGIARANYVGYEAKMGSLVVSSHDANKLWVACVRAYGMGAQEISLLWGSTDKGATGAVVKQGGGTGRITGLSVPYHNNPGDQVMYLWIWDALGNERKSLDGGSTLSAISPPTVVRFRGMMAAQTWNQLLVRAIGEIGGQDTNGELTISQDGASSWAAGIDLGMVVWSVAGFPYDEQLMYFGRARAPVLDNYPNDPNALLVEVTRDGGGTLLDKSGNLRADFNVKCIVGIVPDWLED